MAELSSPIIVFDAISWQQIAREGIVELPWPKLLSDVLPITGDARLYWIVNPAQHALMSLDIQEQLGDVLVANPSERSDVLASFAERGALIVSSLVAHPYERWLPARLSSESPVGLRMAPADGLQRYLESRIVKALPQVSRPLSSLLHNLVEPAELIPAFADVMALMSLPTSPFELHERIATLCDERLVVHLDRFLRSRLRELVLFDGMTEAAIDEAIERRQLTMRIRQAWAQQLQVVATASRREQQEKERAVVQAVLGFPPKEVEKEDAQARLDVLPYVEEHTTLAYQVDGEIHILNPDPEQEQELQAFPHVRIHKKEERPPPLWQILDVLSDWTLDHYREDPQLDGLLERLTRDVSDSRLYKYARAYISYLGFPTPSALPRPLRDWRPALQKLFALQPPATSIRYQYPAAAQPSSPRGLAIIEGGNRPEKTLYSPMNCIATPAAAVTLHRGRRYVQVHLASALLGYGHQDIFSPGDEYDGQPTEELERKRPLRRHRSPSRPAAAVPQEGHELYVEYPFRHAGLAEEYIVFPMQRTTEGSVASTDLNEFLKFYQLNLALQKISEQLSQNPAGKVSIELAENIVPDIQKIFQPLKRQHVYFTLREHSPFPIQVPWRILDRQIATVWLSLRHALQHQEALPLHDDRAVLPISPGIYAECAVRPLAEGVHLPLEVSLCATQEDLVRHANERHKSFEPNGLVRSHALYEAEQQGMRMAYGPQLPLPLQIIGDGLCAEIRFFASPLQTSWGHHHTAEPPPFLGHPTPDQRPHQPMPEVDQGVEQGGDDEVDDEVDDDVDDEGHTRSDGATFQGEE